MVKESALAAAGIGCELPTSAFQIAVSPIRIMKVTQVAGQIVRERRNMTHRRIAAGIALIRISDRISSIVQVAFVLRGVLPRPCRNPQPTSHGEAERR